MILNYMNGRLPRSPGDLPVPTHMPSPSAAFRDEDDEVRRVESGQSCSCRGTNIALCREGQVSLLTHGFIHNPWACFGQPLPGTSLELRVFCGLPWRPFATKHNSLCAEPASLDLSFHALHMVMSIADEFLFCEATLGKWLLGKLRTNQQA